MKRNRPKICFVHPALMDYRIELFDKINQTFDVTFIFTKQGRGQLNVKEKHLNIPINWKHKVITTKFIIKSRDIGMLFRLTREMLFGKYDVFVVSNSWYLCWLLSKVTKKKFVFWIEFWYWEKKSIFRNLLNRFTFYICKHSNAVIATGKKSLEQQLNLGVDPAKIFYHPQCSKDYSRLKVPSIKSEMNILDKKVILFVGRLVESKGLDILLKSMISVNNKYKDTILLVVGTGPQENYYKTLVSELSIKNVHFVGYIGDELKKAALYEACDIFVLPAVFINGAYEPWGLVINEAMAFGKPIIATDAVGSAFDLVKNNVNGYIVESGNINMLSEAISNILSDEELALKMQLNSKKIFQQKNNCKNLAQVFIDAINSK